MAIDVPKLTKEAGGETPSELGQMLAVETGFAAKRYRPEAVAAFSKVLKEACIDGKPSAIFQLQEASHTADFPYLFGDVLDRTLMAQWGSTIPNWEAFTKVGTLKDFRDAKRYGITGMGSVLDKVGERAEYKERGPSEETPHTRYVEKYGGRFGISFETLINDDLDALRDLPQTLVLAARRTEALAVASLYWGSTGFDTTLFTAGRCNIATTGLGMTTTNAALSVQSLGEAIQVMDNQVDVDGFPINVDAYTLVTGAPLEVTANNILNALQIESVGMFGAIGASGDAGVNAKLTSANWLSGKLNYVKDTFGKLVANSNAATTWFLFASKTSPRTAIEVNHLRGHEAPELFVKAPNASRIGGGMVAESFENDEVEYKVRHIFGANQWDYRAAFASNGSGS